MTKSISITSIVALLFLSGCSGYETLAQDSEIDGYTVQGLNWSSGRTTLVFLKAFDHQDKLAICSAYTGSGHGDPYSRIDRRLFDTANIYIGEERIGPMSFSNTVRQDKVKWHLADDQVVVTEFEGSINCVGTDREWKDSYRHSPIIFRGPNRIRIEI